MRKDELVIPIWNRHGVVDVVTRLWGGSVVRFPARVKDISSLRTNQTSYETHPVLLSGYCGLFPRGQSGRNVKVTSESS